MGDVYEAYDREREVTVALKTLRHVDARAVARFKREFRALADIEHPNLVSLGELIAEGGQWFFTMELVTGTDFLAYICDARGRSGEPTPAYDEARLRAALAQLARGLDTIHRANRVHRDIKPTNVLVTPEGRVVLLDFGLVTSIVPDQQSSRRAVVGTAEYMAPEQAVGRDLGPAADWYSVGVLLYEALTGRLPHTGITALELMMKKQEVTPLPPREVAPGVPDDLDELCVELLRTDPTQRPAGDDILARLGDGDVAAAAHRRSSHVTAISETTPFVGRTEELALLRAAFEDSRQPARGPVTVFVNGESGCGKSELVRVFTEELRRDSKRVLVLTGRCYERESVPYNAFDDIAEALGRHLARLSETAAAYLLPRRSSLLGQLFPILRRVEVIANAPILRTTLDPQEQRSRMFWAFRDLLARVADESPVVLVIDDFQWAGADSMMMLGEIMHPGEAPQVLLLATVRSDVGPPSIPKMGDVRHIDLGELRREEGRELVEKLAPRLAPDSAQEIADEAGGHPLFILELVRDLEEGKAGETSRLDEALWSRISRLEEQPRRLLELLAVAGAPIAEEIATDALGLEYDEYQRAARILRIGFLARTRSRRANTIETYHDRVRRAVTTHVHQNVQTQHHRRLAIALEHGGAAATDPQLLVQHFSAAGELARAAEHAEAAAHRASEASAFEQAAELYGTALDHGRHEGAQKRRLMVQLGEALLNAGRGAEAARAFLDAAVGADAEEVLDLEVRAGGELLRCGRVEEGVETLRPSLAAAGFALPNSMARLAVLHLVHRLHIRLRGLGFRVRPEEELPPETQVRIDTFHAAATGLSMVETVRGAYTQTRHLSAALRHGDEYRIGRALLYEAAFLSIYGAPIRQRVDNILATARDIVYRLGDPYLTALHHTHTALALYQRGQWREALEHARIAVRGFRENCSGHTWELDCSQIYALWALYWLGDYRELTRRAEETLRDARRRGDRYAIVCLATGLPSFAHLVADDPAACREDIEEAAAHWPDHGYHLQHYWIGFARAQCDFYEGDPAAALERIEEHWRAARRAFLLRVVAVRSELIHFRARCALAIARASADSSLLRRVGRLARRLDRQPLAWCRPAAEMLRAGVSTLRGDDERARRQLEAAERGLRDADTIGLATVAKYVRGQIVGGDPGRVLIEESRDWMEEQGIVNPQGIVRFYAPGFDRPARLPSGE